MEYCSCTERCRSKIHGAIICAALTKRDVTDLELCAYFNQICYCCESVRDELGRTALHLAASVGRVDVVKWLLKRKQININARDGESGYTAFHRSIFYGKINCAVALMQAGANNVYDHDNYTCIDQAMKNNPFEISFGDDIDDGNISGDVYVWGSNTNYIFGIQQARHTPDLWDTFHKEHSRGAIKQISLEKFHCLMVSRDGHAYSCGHGQGGRLGLGSEQTALIPKQIKFTDNQRQMTFDCVKASIARDHSVFLTESDSIYHVWACGLNTHHVLGINPPPPKLLSPKRLSNFKYDIYGVCAARYHSVAWGPKAVYTWGFNGGQLGHDQNNEKYITLPKLVTNLFKMKQDVQEVATSSGATVAITSVGEIFVLHEYQCRKIHCRQKLLNVSVTGGRLDTSLDTSLLAEKNAELKILVLTDSGRILLWQESDQHLTRCILSLNREIFVMQVVMNMSEILFINNEGEAFQGTIKNRKKKSGESSTMMSRNTVNNSLREPFHNFLDKDECHSVKVTKLPRVHRAVAISTDLKGGNFSIIQASPKNMLRALPNVIPGTIMDDIKALLEETDDKDYIHSIIFKVDNRIYPAHRYIVACSSEKLRTMMINTKQNIIEINNTHGDIFKELLLWIYTGKCNLSDVGPCPKKLLNLFITNDTNQTNLTDLKNQGGVNRGMGLNETNGLFKECNSENNDLDTLQHNLDKSTFEYYKKAKKNKSKTDGMNNNKDPVRLLQELAKRLEIIDLEKRLSKLTFKDGKIEFSKGYTGYEWTGCYNKKCFDRFQHTDLYDINIICKGGQILQAHRCILVARVDFFQKMYSNRWNQEALISEISFPYSKAVVESFLEFIYTDELLSAQTLDFEILCNLLILSDQYFVLRLKEICEVSLCNLLSFKNTTQLLSIADMYNAEKLKTYTIEFICVNLPAFLESRLLEDLDNELLNELTNFYCTFNKALQNRIITPYSTAPSDEEIRNISNMYPISLDIDDEFQVQNKSTPKSQRRRARMHKSSLSDNNPLSGDDFSPEKPEQHRLDSPLLEENEDKTLFKTVPIRIKAINIAHEKIKDENETTSFIKLTSQNSEANSAHFGSSFEDFPLLNNPSTSIASCAKSPNKLEKCDRHKIQRLSQKQRKRLSSEESIKDVSCTSLPDSPKNPWKIHELSSPVGSPEAQTNMNVIITQEKKQKENFQKMITKPLLYTQIEDKAIEDLHRFYNSSNALEEVITAGRVSSGSISAPVWVQKSK